MGLETVAEGIEEAEEGRMLKGLGCTLAQGYHYAKPMEEADVIAFIRNTKPFEI
jgi:EAL domain-containing protein (putative c-di-GMP-specific phosphodiesterase class I)